MEDDYSDTHTLGICVIHQTRVLLFCVQSILPCCLKTFFVFISRKSLLAEISVWWFLTCDSSSNFVIFMLHQVLSHIWSYFCVVFPQEQHLLCLRIDLIALFCTYILLLYSSDRKIRRNIITIMCHQTWLCLCT